MKELVFQVEFLSDIVLPASSNTEGNIESLDFIPGSNFLGMVAREYSKFSDSFAVFHSGKVRFGDAVLVHNGKLTYKMPLSFFHEKLKPEALVNHHLIDDFSTYTQLKQKRKGFITKDLEELSIKHNYSQKSAYDKEHRRSKDSTMYGYNAIPSNTLWQFSVKYDDISESDTALLKKNLIGKKRLGKSKSSQYGLVEISESKRVDTVACTVAQKETTVVYVKSRLALVKEDGTPTYDLKYLVDGLTDKNIVWEQSQIKTSTFMPYNGAMQTKCYERVVINSGSVVVLKDLTEVQLSALQEGIGVYLCEGFGEVLINPAFLDTKGEFTFADTKVDGEMTKITVSDPMVKFLNNKQTAQEETLDLASTVNRFIQSHASLYKSISNSQWGTIRSICHAGNESFREDIRDYVSSGKVTWKNEQIETLLEENKSKAFIKLLSMQMPKLKKDK